MADKKENKTVNLNIRVEEQTKKDLTVLADQDRRTLSDYIRLQLENIVEATKKK